MPITLTYDFDTSTVNSNDRNRINLALKRLGWENVGGSAWRYPEFTTDYTLEDWFNHVIPALMYFRSVVNARNITVTKFTLDVSSSSGYRQHTAGEGVKRAQDIVMYPQAGAGEAALSEQRLRQWIQACEDAT